MIQKLKFSILSLLLALCFSTAAMAAEHPAVPNRDPLLSTPFVPLPLGNVRPAGWLLTELNLQRDGLTGHAEQVIPRLGPDSGWLGGTGHDAEDWEKGPYYTKGLVALAYVLDDDGLKHKALKWIDWSINSQRPDGSFGPLSNNEWWPRMVMTYAIRQYGEATGDPRVVPMLQRYLHYMLAELPHRPLKEWAKARAGDQIDTAFWVYNRTGDPAMLQVADLLHAQAYDWTDIYTHNRFADFGADFMPKHGVNVAQALKMPPVWYQRSRAAVDRDAFAIGMTHLLAGTTLPLDVLTGTEMLSGRCAIQGSETCTVVEQMLSDETAVGILADPVIADMLERTGYNALPGAMTKDLKQYQYYTPTNNVEAIRGGHGFTQDYADSMLPGPVSGFPCCCYNLHMGWPMLVQHMWMATDDGGLAAIVYGPTTVHAALPTAGDVTVTEQTDYPFDGVVHLTISPAHAAAFPIKLRIPGWCETPSLSLNGQPQPPPRAGTFIALNRNWTDGDRIDLNFPMPLNTIRGVNNSISLARGPLVFSLKMPEHRKVTKPGPDGFDQLELTSPAPWNVALAIDPSNPLRTVEVHTSAMPQGSPYEPDQTPVTLTVPARLLPTWAMDWTGRIAQDPPLSPVKSDAPSQSVTLVPFGAQTLRVTAFPWLGAPTEPATSYHCDFHNTDAPGWVDYGGGWYVDSGAFRTPPQSSGNSYGTAGMKAIASGTRFANFVYDADVTPAPVGDTGLIFRVSHPAIGADAYDGYYAGVSRAGSAVIGKATAATNRWTPLSQAKLSIPPDHPLHLRVAATGSTIQFFVDDMATPVLAITDTSYTTGAIGVRTYAPDSKRTASAFANISVAETSAARQ